MSDYKHTPAPWKIGLIKMETDTYLSVWPEHTAESQTGTAVCLISAYGKINEQDEANARLIAACPSLLTALINLLEHREGTEEGNKARKEAELLIQKIRGHE